MYFRDFLFGPFTFIFRLAVLSNSNLCRLQHDKSQQQADELQIRETILHRIDYRYSRPKFHGALLGKIAIFQKNVLNQSFVLIMTMVTGGNIETHVVETTPAAG